MDYRKIIEFSSGSFVVTLPKSWVVRHKLKKGESILVDESFDQLVFYPSARQPEKRVSSTSIVADNKSMDTIRAEIITAYLGGFHTIEILSRQPQNATLIKSVIRNLSGMEILEQSSTKIVATDLLDPGSISIPTILQRMDIINRSMIEELQQAMKDKEDTQAIAQRDSDINRLYYLGYRVANNAMKDAALQKKLDIRPWDLLNHFRMLQRIEETADRQKRIARLLPTAALENMLEEFRALHEQFSKRYATIMKSFYSKDKQLAYEIEISNPEYIKRCDELLEKIAKRLAKKQPAAKQLLAAIDVVDYVKSCHSFVKFMARIVLTMD